MEFFPRLTCYKTAVNRVLYLFRGQTWASGWIFKNAIFPPLDRRLQTRGLVHCHTCRTGPVYAQHQSAQTSRWNQQVTVITHDFCCWNAHFAWLWLWPCRRWASPSSWLHCPPWWSLWKPARETSEQTWTDWRRADGYIWSTHTLLQGDMQKKALVPLG